MFWLWYYFVFKCWCMSSHSNYLIAQEEDLVDVETKLERIDVDFQTKAANFEELKREIQKLRQIVTQHQATISSMMADCGPLQVYYYSKANLDVFEIQNQIIVYYVIGFV